MSARLPTHFVALLGLISLALFSECAGGGGSGSGGGGNGVELRAFVGDTTGPEIFDAARTNPDLEFGTITLGDPNPPAIDVVLSSEGRRALEISNMTLIDPTGAFTLDDSALVTPLAGGSTTRFSVSFAPQSDGPYLAVVAFSHNAGSTADQSFSMTFTADVLPNNGGGGGGNPTPTLEVDVGGTSVSHGDSATAPLTYADVDIASGSPIDKTVTVTNSGTADLSLDAASLTGTGTSAYTLTPASTLPLTLTPSMSTTLTLTFAPATAGTHDVTLELAHSVSASPSPFTLGFTGTGTQGQTGGTPDISVDVDATSVAHGDSGTAPLTYADVDVASGSPIDKTITITNSGMADFELSAAALTGTGTTAYMLTPASALPLTLTPSASTTLTLTFAPSTAGAHDITLELAHTITGTPSPFTLGFTGTGTQTQTPPSMTDEVIILVDGLPVRDFDAFTGPLDFGYVEIGSPDQTKTVTILNDTSSPVTLESALLADATHQGHYALNFSGGGAGSSIPAGMSLDFELTYSASTMHPTVVKVGLQIKIDGASRAYTHLGFLATESEPADGGIELDIYDITRDDDERWKGVSFSGWAGTPTNAIRLPAGFAYAARMRLQTLRSAANPTTVTMVEFSGGDAASFRAEFENNASLPHDVYVGNELYINAVAESAVPAALSTQMLIHHSSTQVASPISVDLAAEFIPVTGNSVDQRLVWGGGVALNQAIGHGTSFRLAERAPDASSTMVEVQMRVLGNTPVTFSNPVQSPIPDITFDVSALPTTINPGQSLTTPVTSSRTTQGDAGNWLRIDTDLPSLALAGFTLYQNSVYPQGARVLSYHDGQIETPEMEDQAAPRGDRIFANGTAVGSTSAAAKVAVKYQGAGGYDMLTPSITGSGQSEFSLGLSEYSGQARADRWPALGVSFAPTTPGIKSATVVMEADPLIGSGVETHRAKVIGWALDPTGPFIAVTQEELSGDPVTSGQSASLPARGVYDGQTTPYWFCIANCSTNAVSLALPQLAGSGAQAFELDLSSFTTTIESASYAWIGVRFNPASVGTFDTTIVLSTPGSGTPLFSLEIQGEGVLSDPRGKAVGMGYNAPGKFVAIDYDPVIEVQELEGVGAPTPTNQAKAAVGPFAAFAYDEWYDGLGFLRSGYINQHFHRDWEFQNPEEFSASALVTDQYCWDQSTGNFYSMGMDLNFTRSSSISPSWSSFDDYRYFWYQGESYVALGTTEIELWRLDQASGDWVQLVAPGGPPMRDGQTLTVVGDSLVAWGGEENSAMVNTGAIYDFTSGQWTAMSTANAPTAVSFPAASKIGDDKFFVWGGYPIVGSVSNYHEGGAIYDLSTGTWTALPTNGGPGHRARAGAVFDGEDVILVSGLAYDTGNGFPPSGWRYDPVADTWSAPSPSASAYNSKALIFWSPPVK